MKTSTIKTIFFSLVAFILLGCEDIYLEDENNTTNVNIDTDNGSIPVIKSPTGSYVDLSEYLYPKDLTTDKTYYFRKVYDYAQTFSNTFTDAPDVFERSYTKTIIGDVTRIIEYKDGQQQKYDDVKKLVIVSYDEEENSYKELDIRVAKNSEVSDSTQNEIQEVCVVVYIGSIDLSTTTYLPLYVRNDLLNNQLKTENGEFQNEQFNFDEIIHIYCGTSDNHTTDTYYSKKYGRVLEIQKDIDSNLIKVEVADVLSMENE